MVVLVKARVRQENLFSRSDRGKTLSTDFTNLAVVGLKPTPCQHPNSRSWLLHGIGYYGPASLNSLTVNSLLLLRLAFTVALLALAIPPSNAQPISSNLEIIVSVAEQRLALVNGGIIVKKFPVSTSRFGLGDNFGSYKTPIGRLRVCLKLGNKLPEGAVFKRRNFSGEVLARNARARDPIVTRILWLEGVESCNKNARRRCIYIHGTPQERSLGKATSFGCVRMRSHDVVEVFDAVPVGTAVTIVAGKLPRVRNAGLFRFMVFRTASRDLGRS
jgi:L,D-transpeptidase catalytic domain